MYGKDPESYFLDNALVYSDLVSDCDLVIAGGDLNARTKNELDYIVDIDSITPERSNPDQEKNSHGNHFIQFLKDNRALILNGRVTPARNNFTFVKAQGRSVPDYMYCPSDHIQYCSSCEVLPVSDIINSFNLTVPHSLPDHSVIVNDFDLFSFVTTADSNAFEKSNSQCYQKKNVRKINNDFMCSQETVNLVKNTITRLEAIQLNQVSVDSVYDQIKSIFITEINKLPNVPAASTKQGRRSLSKSAQFWNAELQQAWLYRCSCEKAYLNFHSNPSNIFQRQQKQQLHLAPTAACGG